ncbi:hypothetical protein FSY75_30755 [Streptomyces sp. TR1341]|nr:hypothetical protein [Streptomyces sp. TR1341]
MARDHGFGWEEQMQGQMHVHATEMDSPVPLLGHFFCHLHDGFRQWYRPSPRPACRKRPGALRFRNRTSTARSVLVADFGP